MIINEEDYLEHFGVAGMRWGVLNEEDSEGLRTKLKIFSDKQKHEPITSEVKQLAKLNEDTVLDAIEAFYDGVKHSLFYGPRNVFDASSFFAHFMHRPGYIQL